LGGEKGDLLGNWKPENQNIGGKGGGKKSAAKAKKVRFRPRIKSSLYSPNPLEKKKETPTD